jgi:hypothetical protein
MVCMYASALAYALRLRLHLRLLQLGARSRRMRNRIAAHRITHWCYGGFEWASSIVARLTLHAAAAEQTSMWPHQLRHSGLGARPTTRRAVGRSA